MASRTLLDARPASASASNWHDSQPRVAVAGHQRPNFLLLLADDMGFADWPGLSGVSLPHLDALASGGTRPDKSHHCPIWVGAAGSPSVGAPRQAASGSRPSRSRTPASNAWSP